MALSGQLLLMLLLMLSHLVVVTSVRSLPESSSKQILGPEWSQQNINKPKEAAKAVGRAVLGNLVTVLPYAIPFLGLVPVHGTLIAASVNVAMLPLTMLDKRNSDKLLLNALQSEFEDLNLKIDKYHEQQKYDTWASSTFSKPEKHIELGWRSYKTTLKALIEAKDVNERDRHRDEFITSYTKYEPAIKELNRLLLVPANGPSFTSNLGVLLAKHIRCHEKELMEYTEFINKLIAKGIMMNQFYYKVKKIGSRAREDEEGKIAYTSAKAMFNIHMECIYHSKDYVRMDVVDLIDNMKHRSQLAQDVRKFLDDAYGRYDWMVVAFITKNSKHRIMETLNKHVLAGFTEVTKGLVTVAVARQVKGTHTKARLVADVIKQCVSSKTLCYKVRETLGTCTKTVNIGSGVTLLVTSAYSAVHAYTRHAHDSHDADDVMADPEDTSPQTPFIYKGPCEESPGVKRGKFVVLIKSDEELMKGGPCDKVDCGGPRNGECVPMPDISLGICQCKHPFYGKTCNNNLNDYVAELRGERDSAMEEVRRG